MRPLLYVLEGLSGENGKGCVKEIIKGGDIMPRKSPNTFTVENDVIYINRDGWQGLAMATYREDYADEVCNATWRLDNNEYPISSKLGTLHSYMAKKWYGEDKYNEMKEQGFIVEHMNNHHLDSRITNLTFLLKRYNTAKGQSLDIDMREMRQRLAVTMYRDFNTGCYQISIGCNDLISTKTPDGEEVPIHGIWLLYLPETDYRLVIADAQNILTEYETSGMFNLGRGRHCKIRLEAAQFFQLSKDEINADCIQRNGETYLIGRPGRIWIHALAMQEGWLPDHE